MYWNTCQILVTFSLTDSLITQNLLTGLCRTHSVQVSSDPQCEPAALEASSPDDELHHTAAATAPSRPTEVCMMTAVKKNQLAMYWIVFNRANMISYLISFFKIKMAPGAGTPVNSKSHYLIQCWPIGNWTLQNKYRWNWNKNKTIFIEEN